MVLRLVPCIQLLRRSILHGASCMLFVVLSSRKTLGSLQHAEKVLFTGEACQAEGRS